MYRTFLLLSLLLIVSNVFAQFNKKWEARYTETGYSDESAKKIVTDRFGNSFLLGDSDLDAVLIKYNQEGVELWNYQTGRGTPISDPAKSKDLVIDQQGNAYVLVYVKSALFPEVFELFKISPDGILMWKTQIQNINGADPYPSLFKLVVDLDDNLMCITQKEYGAKISINKFNGLGELLWTRDYTKAGKVVFLTDAIIDSRNNIVISGYSTLGLGATDKLPLLVVYDSFGNETMDGSEAFGSLTPSENNYPIKITESNSIIYLAFIKNELWKIDENLGTVIQVIMLGSSASVASRYLQVDDEGFLYSVDDGNDNLVFRKYTPNGNLVWTNNYNPSIGSTVFTEDYEIIDSYFDKKQNKLYVLALMRRTNLFSGGSNFSYLIYESSSDKQFRIVSTISSTKGKFIPCSFDKDSQDNFIVAGKFDNGTYDTDLFMMRINPISSIVLGESFFLPVNSMPHRPEVVVVDSHGNTYVGGQLSSLNEFRGSVVSYFGIIKYDKAGKEVWRLKYSPQNAPNSAHSLRGMVVTVNDEIIVTGNIAGRRGYPYTYLPDNVYTIKFDSNGNLVWKSKSDLQIGQSAQGLEIKLDSNGNVYVLASLDVANYGTKLAVFVYDSEGNPLWNNIWGFNMPYYKSEESHPTLKPFMSVLDDSVLIGYSDVDQSNITVRFRKFDNNGTLIFDKPLTIESLVEGASNSIQYLLGMDILPNGNISALTKGFTYGDTKKYGRITEPSHFYYLLTHEAEIIYDKLSVNQFSNVLNAGYAIDVSGQSYSMLLKYDEFVFQKRNSMGDIVWTKTKSTRFSSRYLDTAFPTLAFIKKNGNPVFFSTSEMGENTNNFILIECDSESGEELYVEEFDGGYDSHSFWDIYNYHTDQLIHVVRIANTDDFVITGFIQDKNQRYNTSTIATLRYGTNGQNVAPVLKEEIVNQSAEIGKNYSFTVPLPSFFDTDPLSYKAVLSDGTSLPSWLHFDESMRTFSGTPAEVQVYEIMVTATDTEAASASDIFTLSIIPANIPPVLIEKINDQTAEVGKAYSFTFASTTFRDTQTLTFNASLSNGSSLPSWLSFDAIRRTFYGVPIEVKAYEIMITATDTESASVSDIFTLSIILPPNIPPVINEEIIDQTTEVGKLYSFTFPSTIFKDTQTLTYTASLSNGSSLPSWLSFDASGRTFSGIPIVVQEYEIMVTAIDTESASVSDTFKLSIVLPNTNPYPIKDLPEIIQLQSQEFFFSFKDYFKDDEQNTLFITIKFEGTTNLPEWLVWDNISLELKGKPLLKDLGTYTFLIQISDGVGGAFETTLRLDILDTTTSIIDRVVNSIQIYPVPSKSILNIDQPYQGTQLKIISSDGKTISMITLKENHDEITLTEFKSGNYLLYFTNYIQKFAYSIQLVKE
jgi:hypothetical protein